MKIRSPATKRPEAKRIAADARSEDMDLTLKG
jgi:hypothetical protein